MRDRQTGKKIPDESERAVEAGSFIILGLLKILEQGAKAEGVKLEPYDLVSLAVEFSAVLMENVRKMDPDLPKEQIRDAYIEGLTEYTNELWRMQEESDREG